jgi:molybdopterin synthase sulfur carrier subunit
MNRSINVRLFGAFRQGNPESSLTVEIPEGGRVADLRQAMELALDSDNARSLLKASAFATDSAVLDDQEPVPEQDVSILPPVCGG